MNECDCSATYRHVCKQCVEAFNNNDVEAFNFVLDFLKRKNSAQNQPDDFLDKVRSTLDEREGEYGNAQEMFDKIAARWSITLGHTITARQVALCMIDLKLSRLSVDLNHDDSMIDAAGYITLMNGLRDG